MYSGTHNAITIAGAVLRKTAMHSAGKSYRRYNISSSIDTIILPYKQLFEDYQLLIDIDVRIQ